MRKHYILLLCACILTLISCGGTHAGKDNIPSTAARHDVIGKVESLAMSEPHRALSLLDSAEATGYISPFIAQVYRSMIYFNPLQEDNKVIECANSAMEMDSKELNDRMRIALLRLLGSSYYLTGEYESSIKASMLGESIATAIDSAAAQGEFRFMIGECMMRLGQKSTGMANMEYGITVLSHEDGRQASSTLSHLLGEEMTFLIEDGKVKEAVSVGERREAILNEIRSRYGHSDYLDQQFGYLYGKMALLHEKTGEQGKAEECADKFMHTDYSKDKNGRLRILEYYLEAKHPGKALDIIGDTDFPASGDTMSVDGCYYLKLKADAYHQDRDNKRAYSLLSRAWAIADSLDRKTNNEKALKAFAMYRTHEAELEAKEAEAREAKYALWLIVILAICVIMAAVFLHYYYRTKNLIEKNRLIAMGRSDAKEYVKLLQSAQAKIQELTPKGDVSGKAAEADSWQLFLRLEDAMEKRKLYLDKTITRADILELLGISKNRLAQMFQDVGGELSLPTYINGKRLNHALEVIVEHPEYTVSEVSEASGFSNTRNFHLLFKKRFGITPLQYRNGK